MPSYSDDKRGDNKIPIPRPVAASCGWLLWIWNLGIFLSGSLGLVLSSTGEPALSRGSALKRVSAVTPLWGGPTTLTAVRLDRESPRDLHHFDSLSCETCHRAASTSAQDVSSFATIGFEVDIQRSCTLAGCHPWDPAMNHPVGVRLSGPGPAGIRLDAASKITCLSCHEIPTSSADTGTPGNSRRMLFVPEGLSACGTCHERMPNSGRNGSHWRFSAKAHLTGRITPGPSESDRPLERFSSVDEESRSCLNCHETITAVVPPETETPQQKQARFQRMSDHPIGMNYRQKAGAEPRNFKFPLTDPDRVRLFDGRVGCGSCHSLYSRRASYLVAEFRGGALCRTCHDR